MVRFRLMKIQATVPNAERESRWTIDLTFNGSRIVEISNAITSRYDAGICKHKLERTGVCDRRI